MNRLNATLTAEEVIDLKLLRDRLRDERPHAPLGLNDWERDQLRFESVMNKVIQGIGPKLEKHEEP